MRIALLAVAVLVPAFVFAQTSSPLEFAKGPARWLMTADEQRAFRTVKSATAAQELVDLFWARRDPTPGTFINEFRDDFRERVEFADRRFKESGRRGSMTERGRVLVVLGFPQELGEEAGQKTSQMMGGASGAGGAAPGYMDPTGGRTMANKDVWNYSHEQAVKFSMPKIEVVFIHDQTGGRARRDTHRNDFVSALPRAIEYYIKSPELTTVPEWARRDIPFKSMTADSGEGPAPTAMDAPLPDAPLVAEAGDAPLVSGTGPGSPAPKKAVRPASVGKLTLVKDAFAIQPQTGVDPFSRLASIDVFDRKGEMGWLLEQCTGSTARTLDAVEVTLKITGFINGERVNFNAPPEELAPDSIKASPGCYLIRGSVPLMDMDPGAYTLLVKVGAYNLTKDFRVIE